MSNVQEIWKPIQGFEGYYEVGDQGNIKSLKREVKTGEYYHAQMIEEKLMKPSKDKDGYRRVQLSKEGKKYYRRVNRLVCTAFHPNPENKPQVNHKNGFNWDDRADNLEWATVGENLLHSYRVLKRKAPKSAFKKGENTGSENYSSKPVIQLDLEGNEIKRFDSISLADKDGFQHENICKVLKGKYKTHGGFKWKYA